MSAPAGLEEACRDFTQAVNMTPKALSEWLDSDESKAVGQKEGNSESVGHHMGRTIVELSGKKKSDLDERDVADMKKVVGYVHRHLAQQPGKEDIETSRWRYSLMNWGHDPLKD